jgi:hypothetical protein
MMKETIAILLLVACLGLGCVVFYLFLQFYNLSRQAEERQRQILDLLAKIEQRLSKAGLEIKSPDAR